MENVKKIAIRYCVWGDHPKRYYPTKELAFKNSTDGDRFFKCWKVDGNWGLENKSIELFKD